MAKASFNEPNPIPNRSGWHDGPSLTDIERKNLANVLEEEDKNSIQIYLRLRPHSQEEQTEENFRIIDSKTVEVKAPPESVISKSNRAGHTDEARYIFSQVFEPQTSQKVLFNSCVLNPVHNFIDGKSCLLFSYGTSNAGKTHTIHGSKRDPGIIPRVLSILFKSIKGKQCNEQQGLQFRPEFGNSVKELQEAEIKEQILLKEKILNHSHDASGTDLFSTANTHQTDSSYAHISQAPSEFSQMEELIDDEIFSVDDEGNVIYSVWVSFLEIYNELVYDLLAPTTQDKRVPLKIAQDSGKNMFVKGLNHVHVTSGIEAYKVLLVGKNNLQVASTNLNRSSSRSHCVFSIKVIKRENVENPNDAWLSSFSICDLAGAERLEKTGNTGSRMKETQNINTSLHVLVRCFKTMLENQLHPSRPEVVPYRDSKLTQLFHRQLCGKFNEDVIMIVNVNPSPKLFEETAFVLKASAIAKQIVKKPVKPKVNKRKSMFSTLVFENRNRDTIPWEAIEEDPVQPATINLDQIYADFELEKQKIREECEAERMRCVTILDNMIEEMIVDHDNRIEDVRELLISERIRRENLYRDLIRKLNAEIAELKGEQAATSASSGYNSDLNGELRSTEGLEERLRKEMKEKVELKAECCALKKENLELVEKLKTAERESEKAVLFEKELKKSEHSMAKVKQLLEEARVDMLDAENEKSEMQNELSAKDVQIEDLKTEMKELQELISCKNEIIHAEQGELHEKEELVHKLEVKIVSKNKEIEMLQDTIDELKELNERNVCKYDRQLNLIESERDQEKGKRACVEKKLKELESAIEAEKANNKKSAVSDKKKEELESVIEENGKKHKNIVDGLERKIAEMSRQLEDLESRQKPKRTNRKQVSQWSSDDCKENEPVHEAKTEPRRKLRTRNQTKARPELSPYNRRSQSSDSRVLLGAKYPSNNAVNRTPRTNSCSEIEKNQSKSCRKKLYNPNEFLDTECQGEPVQFHSLIVSSPKSELKNVKRRLRNQLK